MPFFKECQQLNLRLFECPSFLFVIMGLVTIIAIISTYFVTSYYAGPEIVIVATASAAMVSFVIGHFVVRSVSRIAQAHQMQSDFVSIASHQLRTPLSLIKWAIERKNLDIIKQANQRMLKLVNDLLNVARIEQGQFKLQKEKFDLSKLIREIVQELKTFTQANNAKIILPDQSLVIFADKLKIKMVLENLINNALLYGGKKIIINLNNNKIISIQDNGVGIPKEQQKQVFEKFFRANNILRHQTQGTGLGLYVCQAIIQAHQGKIWFKSKENKGTTFYIKLNKKT